MMDHDEDVALDLSLFKKQWLPLEQAIQRVVTFEHRFGRAHLLLACHAALPSLLTPELVHLLRINFLEHAVAWIAESDLLLSSLCVPVGQSVFELEPQVRQVLLVVLQTELGYGQERLEEIAALLHAYNESPLVSAVPAHVRRTYQWISDAYLDPDRTVQHMFDFLSETALNNAVARYTRYRQVGASLAMLANPLEMTNLQVELEDVVESTYVVLQGYEHKERYLDLLQRYATTLDTDTQVLTSMVVDSLLRSEHVAETTQALPEQMVPPSERTPVVVCCFYANEDRELWHEFRRHLHPLSRQGLITYWDEEMIAAGAYREQEVQRHVANADVILLCISIDFLDSPYYYTIMQRALDLAEAGEIRVIPILLRPIYVEDGRLNRLPILPDNGIPVTSPQWESREHAWRSVISELRASMTQPPLLHSTPPAEAEQRAHTLTPVNVCCFSAEEDQLLQQELAAYLRLLSRQGMITYWDRGMISAGVEREQEIQRHVTTADVILLLISIDFLNSWQCYAIMQQALDRAEAGDVQLIPIFVRAVSYEEERLSRLAILPRDGIPVTSPQWGSRDEAWVSVVRELRAKIASHDGHRAPLPAPLLPTRPAPVDPIEVCCIFAEEDEELYRELEKCLHLLQREGMVRSWRSYPNTPPGLASPGNLSLEATSLIVLLISADFLDADYFDDVLQQSLARYAAGDAHIMAVLLRPVDWRGTAVDMLEMLPTDRRAVTLWNDRDAAFADITVGMRTVMAQWLSTHATGVLAVPPPALPPSATDVLLLYAENDYPVYARLLKHLRSVLRQNLAGHLHAADITSSTIWDEQTLALLRRAQLILLVMSPAMLDTDFCSSPEMAGLLQRHDACETTVVVLLASATDLTWTPFSHVPILPADRRPVTEWHNKDEAFAAIGEEVRKTLEDIASQRSLTRTPRSGQPHPDVSPVDCVYVYVEDDAAAGSRIERHLRILQRQGFISTWHTCQLTQGTEWGRNIEPSIQHAELVLVLISADFLASEYAVRLEQWLMERHRANEVWIIPILVRPVDLAGSYFAHLQPLPTDGVPVLWWSDQNAACVDVERGIRRVIEEIFPLKRVHAEVAMRHTLPYRRNPFFTDREELLIWLHQQFNTPGDVPLSPIALTGLGGIGKTQIALEYAYRYQQEYASLFWMQADSQDTLISFYRTMATVLQLPERDDPDTTVLSHAVIQWLHMHDRWLLIIDHVTEPEWIAPFVSPSKGHILLTTQRATVGTSVAAHVTVEALSTDLGAVLLLRRAGVRAPGEGVEQVDSEGNAMAMDIVRDLGGLPLAIDQAGAYMEETGITLQDYIQLMQQYRNELLRRRGHSAADHPDSVTNTFLLVFALVEQQNAAAADMMQLCTFLASDQIPEEVIIRGVFSREMAHAAAAANRLLLDEMFAVLRSYSLFTYDPDHGTFSIHRLVQAVLLDSMSSQQRQVWAGRAVQSVNEVFPDDVHSADYERYLPHALMCAYWVEQERIVVPEAARLLYKTGSAFAAQKAYIRAESLYRQALSIQQAVPEARSVETIGILNALARLYEAQGQDRNAAPVREQANRIKQEEERR